MSCTTKIVHHVELPRDFHGPVDRTELGSTFKIMKAGNVLLSVDKDVACMFVGPRFDPAVSATALAFEQRKSSKQWTICEAYLPEIVHGERPYPLRVMRLSMNFDELM